MTAQAPESVRHLRGFLLRAAPVALALAAFSASLPAQGVIAISGSSIIVTDDGGGQPTITVMDDSAQPDQGSQQPQQNQASQTPAADLGSISGTVYSQSTGEPLKEAHLTLIASGPRNGPRSSGTVEAVTDTSGNYQFTNLNPGTYRLTVSRQSYVQQVYGETRPGARATPITLSTGQNLTKMDFHLIHTGVITGHILDENGEPMVRAQVEVLQKYYQDGQMELRAVGADSTNDLGQYRVFDLPPGRYYVKATPPQTLTSLRVQQVQFLAASRYGNVSAPVVMGESTAQPSGSGTTSTGYAPQFYPGGTSVAQASPVTLKGGDEVSAIDLTLLAVHTHAVRGTVSGTDACGGGRVVSMSNGGTRTVRMRGNVILMGNSDVDGGSRSFMRAGPINGETGAFEITDVAPGSYFVSAQCGGNLAATQPVEVGDADVTGISLALTPGVELSGTVKLEGDLASSVSNAQVWLEGQNGLMGNQPRSQIDSDGSFDFDAVRDGKYSVHMSSSCGQCYIKSARAGDADLLLNGLQISGGTAPSSIQIVYSSDTGTVSGTVTDTGDAPAANIRVVLVPDAPFRRSDRYRTAFTDSTGKYQIAGVPPGNYEAFAWEAIDDGEYSDPDLIQQFANQSEEIKVDENQTKNVDLKTIPASATGAAQ